jgi:hypothetical protein
MKKKLLLSVILFATIFSFASNGNLFDNYKLKQIHSSTNFRTDYNPSKTLMYGTCLEIALASLNQAFASYDHMILMCAEITITGFLDCTRYARRIRERRVAIILHNLQNCSDFTPI